MPNGDCGPMRPLRRRGLVMAGGALAASAILPGDVRAQAEWPTRPVRYINPFPQGGANGILARILCDKLGELTGQRFTLDFRAGAGGNVGADAIARAVPDGYTIGTMAISWAAVAPTVYPSLPFDPARSFTPISMFLSMPNLLIVRSGLNVTDLAGLIALLRANPGRYTCGNAGLGTSQHLSAEMLRLEARVELRSVAYRGSAPAIADLLADRVDMMFDSIPTALALMREGKVRGLAVTSQERSPVAPEVPTMQETLPGFDMIFWGGVCGPAGLPRPMVERAAALCRQALESPDLKAAFAEHGATPFWKGPAETAAFRAAEQRRLAPIIRAAGIRPA